MNRSLKFLAFALLAGTLVYVSCKKEYSCEGCAEKNKPPIANAGLDKVITLPTDSVLLDGRTSSDPDGTISEWFWTKISGPASVNIIKHSDSITKVKGLVKGTYQFELKVTDNGGLIARDTMQVIVDEVAIANHPPVANAGPDQTITLPINMVTLDGNASTDPDNNIATYTWTKISGPSSFSIGNPNAMQTQVTNLIEGIYLFELKVTDAGGLLSKDTIQITVNPFLSITCVPGNRPLINAQLIPVGTLSEMRTQFSVASANNKILFAGGNNFTDNPGYVYSTVDIYDITTNSWSTASLSQGKYGMGVAVLGSKIFFAGGEANLLGTPAIDWSLVAPTSRIDVYDASSNTWSTSELSEPRYSSQGVSANNKVLFAGGISGITGQGDLLFSNKVDIYDAPANLWSTASLTEARGELTGSAVGNKIYFAGGTVLFNPNDYSSTSRIDIYDALNNSWSTSSLSATKGAHAGIAVNNKIYWAGGRGDGCADYNGCCIVEIKDINTQTSSFANLFQPNAYFEAVLKDNKIVFFTGAGYSSNKFDIYDITTNAWSIGVLSQNIVGASIISVNNTIYVAGGSVNGVLSSQVWKLEF